MRQRTHFLLQLLGLIGLTAIAALLRFHNASPYLPYPDAYQTLLVAQNIRDTVHAVAPMGQGGLVFPGTFAWTRPVMPLLTLGVSNTGLSLDQAARLVALVAGCLAVPMAYVTVRRLLSSPGAGLVAAGLVAINYGHTIYSGFALTETTGVLLQLVVLWLWARQRSQPVEWADPRDLLTGLALGLAILTRYEYVVLLLPLWWWSASRGRGIRLANWTAPMALLGTAAIVLIRPPGGLFSLAQAGRGFVPLAIAATLALGLILVLRPLVKSLSVFTRQTLVVCTLALIAVVFVVIGLAPGRSGLHLFLTHDALVVGLALFGLTFAALHSRYAWLVPFTIVAVGLLAGPYYLTNPGMERYFTHLLPLLLVPAALGGYVLLTTPFRPVRRYALALVLVVAVGLQTRTAWTGLHNTGRGVWFEPGYEAVAAQQLKGIIPPDALIIAALPEPYRYFLQQPTQSVANRAPYLYFDADQVPAMTIVVNDRAMQRLFPEFAAISDTRLRSFLLYEGSVGQRFRYKGLNEPEVKSVKVYKVPTRELQLLLTTDTNPRD